MLFPPSSAPVDAVTCVGWNLALTILFAGGNPAVGFKARDTFPPPPPLSVPIVNDVVTA